MCEFGEEALGEAGHLGPLVQGAVGDLGHVALALDHVVEDQVRQHQQTRLLHRLVVVAQSERQTRRLVSTKEWRPRQKHAVIIRLYVYRQCFGQSAEGKKGGTNRS